MTKTNENAAKNKSGNYFVKFAFYYRMKKLNIQRYSAANKSLWDNFVSTADVHSILFFRDFMEYHSDRFTDYSHMIYKENKLIAVFPANINDNHDVHSHQGLSYGGVLFKPHTSFNIRLNVYQQLLQFLEINNVETLFTKSIPNCYCNDFSENLIFQWLKGECVRTDIYSYLPKASYFNPNRNRMRHLKKVIDVEIRATDELAEFWNQVLIPNLEKRFNVRPVHSIAEMERLVSNFKKQIRFYGAYQKGVLRAGVVLFVHRNVVHAQYSAGDENREDGSLDLLLDFVIRKYNTDKAFSFGTSSERQGEQINEGLLYWKESFRSNNGIQQFFEIKTKYHSALQNRLQ